MRSNWQVRDFYELANCVSCVLANKLWRNGSGKSTLLLSLLRLLDTTSGVIKVDGIDLSLVPRSLIRERCFITVTQDPVVFGQATLRSNLDVGVFGAFLGFETMACRPY